MSALVNQSIPITATDSSNPTWEELANSLENANIMVITNSISILNNTTITGGWTATLSLSANAQIRSKTTTAQTKNRIDLSDISSISVSVAATLIDTCTITSSVRILDTENNVVKKQDKTSYGATSLSLDVSDITGSYIIQIYLYLYRNHVDSQTGSSHWDYTSISNVILNP